jgi:hypothetical protein
MPLHLKMLGAMPTSGRSPGARALRIGRWPITGAAQRTAPDFNRFAIRWKGNDSSSCREKGFSFEERAASNERIVEAARNDGEVGSAERPAVASRSR